ncbi:hypothetical protein RJD24_08920 [Bacillaceae bacterium IKA-2]|nr:hypothetical protein RJD24_08920 [Bacillaceae bacterium IKA-2]
MDKEKYDYYREMLNGSRSKEEARVWFRKAEEQLVLKGKGGDIENKKKDITDSGGIQSDREVEGVFGDD